MSCCEIQGDGVPVLNSEKIVLKVACPEDAPNINCARLRGTMIGGGDCKFPLFPASCRWHDIEWTIVVTKVQEGVDITDDGRESVLVDIDICLRVENTHAGHVQCQLEKGVSTYISQMIDPQQQHRFHIAVHSGFFEQD